MLSATEEHLRQERQEAARALLTHPLLAADLHPREFTLVRRHEPWLTERFRHLLGYRLAVRPEHARLYKRPRTPYADRPARIRPGSAQPGPEDGWAPFSRRHYVLLALSLAALESHHGRAQALIGGLATEVAALGAELSLGVDFDRREERRAFADGLELLCRLGVLRERDGSREAFVARNEQEEALFDIDHVRLADLKATPLALTDIDAPEDLLAEDYPPTEEGERARRRHRIARALVEEPVLYVQELADDERDTYRSQRHRLEPELEELTGLQAERRAEGSALIDRSAALTDVRFPTRSTESLLALLLCERLRAVAIDAAHNPLPGSEVAALLGELRERLELETAGPELDRPVLELLEAHRLIAREPPAQVRVLPALARFSSPTLRSPA